MHDHFRVNGQDFVNTSCCKFKGDIEGLETTHRGISVQQFLPNLRRGYEFLPRASELPGRKSGLRIENVGAVDSRPYSLDSPASILAKELRRSRSIRLPLSHREHHSLEGFLIDLDLNVVE